MVEPMSQTSVFSPMGTDGLPMTCLCSCDLLVRGDAEVAGDLLVAISCSLARRAPIRWGSRGQRLGLVVRLDSGSFRSWIGRSLIGRL